MGKHNLAEQPFLLSGLNFFIKNILKSNTLGWAGIKSFTIFVMVKFYESNLKIANHRAVADPENFGGGGFEAQNLKNSDVFTKIEIDFLAEIGNWTFFSPKFRWSPKKKKVFTKIETDFSPDWLRLGRWGGCIPKWSRIIRNRCWFFGQNRYF